MEKQILVYVGPSLRNIVQAGTSFCSGYPPKLREEIERRPYLLELMVPVQHLAEARRKLRDPGSSMRQIYEKVRGGNSYV